MEIHERMRAAGVSERTLSMERDAWVLIQVLFPHLAGPWTEMQTAMLSDPAYVDIYLRNDQAFGWEPDDPRIEELAQETIAWILAYQPATDPDGWDGDTTAYRLVIEYRRDASPGWQRLMERVEELATEAGYGQPD